MKRNNPMQNAGCCNIPDHHLLVLKVNRTLQRLDMQGLIPVSRDPDEYAPEIPGMIALIVNDTLSEQNIRAVVEEMFGEGNGPNRNDMQELLEDFTELRMRWLWWQDN